MLSPQKRMSASRIWYHKHKIFIDKIKTFHQYVSLTVKRIKFKLMLQPSINTRVLDGVYYTSVAFFLLISIGKSH